jgi:hypothetical protein
LIKSPVAETHTGCFKTGGVACLLSFFAVFVPVLVWPCFSVMAVIARKLRAPPILLVLTRLRAAIASRKSRLSRE